MTNYNFDKDSPLLRRMQDNIRQQIASRGGPDVEEGSTTAATGIVERPATAATPSVTDTDEGRDEVAESVLNDVATNMVNASSDPEQLMTKVFENPRMSNAPVGDLANMETLRPLEETLDLGRSATIDATLQTMNRDAAGIRESLRPSVTDAGGADVDVKAERTRESIANVPATEEALVDNVTDSGGSDVDAKAASTRESIDATSFGTLKIGDERTSIPEAAHLTTMFDGLADVEGDFNHVDGRGYFTMPYGVVPDNGSVKRADGTAFNPRSGHGYTTDTAGSVDTSNATHTLRVGSNSYTVRRSDYDSDEAFARGVVSLYNREAENIYGEGWDDLTEGARSMALDMAWNGGVGAVGWSSVRNAMQEAGKENPSTETLFGFTANMRSGINYPRGLFKRRLIQYNMIANPEDAASTYSTEALTRDGKRVGTRYIAHRADGTNIGSWDRYDVADNPATEANEKRVASNEIIEANVGLD